MRGRLLSTGLLVTCTLVFFLAACEQNTPSILTINSQHTVVSDYGSGMTYDALSLSLRVNDEDGVEDLESLFIMNYEEELYWKFISADWHEEKRNQEVWISLPLLRMPDFSPIPAGKYQINLFDLSGKKGESNVTISSLKTDLLEKSVPAISIDEESVTVVSQYDQNRLLIFGRDNTLLRILVLKNKTLPLNELTFTDTAEGNQLYLKSNDVKTGIVYLSGPAVF